MLYSDTCIIIFTRVPVVGKVKTRLIPALGADGACDVHTRLLQRTLKLCQEQRLCHAELWIDRDLPHPLISGGDLACHIQVGNDLGARLHNAMSQGLARYKNLLFIGSDCPKLDESYLRQAIQALEQGSDLVLGPALDGGYVLMGIGGEFPQLFADIEWGTDKVLQQTLKQAKLSNLSSILLSPLPDIDRPSDLRYFS